MEGLIRQSMLIFFYPKGRMNLLADRQKNHLIMRLFIGKVSTSQKDLWSLRWSKSLRPSFALSSTFPLQLWVFSLGLSPLALVFQKELGVRILKKVVYLGGLLGQGGKENRIEENKLQKCIYSDVLYLWLSASLWEILILQVFQQRKSFRCYGMWPGGYQCTRGQQLWAVLRE